MSKAAETISSVGYGLYVVFSNTHRYTRIIRFTTDLTTKDETELLVAICTFTDAWHIDCIRDTNTSSAAIKKALRWLTNISPNGEQPKTVHSFGCT